MNKPLVPGTGGFHENRHMNTSHLISWAAVAALTAGCAGTPRDGSEQGDYYIAKHRAAAPVESPTIRTLEAPPAPPVGRGPADVAHTVYFGFDQWYLEPQYAEVVQKHGAFLRANPHRSVMLEGHTDERGGTEYNVGLGQRRAETVRAALSRMGVSDRQIEAVSYGEERPASLEITEEGYRLNRRVEFNYR